MKKSVWAMLNEQEKELLRKVEPDALRDLDEDELSAVHDRIRRARNKYSKNYRRQAAAQVGKDASRAKAHAKNARTAVKAEAFEDALARTSRRLAKLARRREERAAQRAFVVHHGGDTAALPLLGDQLGKGVEGFHAGNLPKAGGKMSHG